VNKSQLIDALAARFDGNKKAAAHALESVLDTITREVARGEKVAITGFGSFEKRLRPPRLVRNPQTGEQIKTKKTFVLRFRPGANVRDVVSGVKKLPKLALSTVPGRRTSAVTGSAAPTKVAANKSASATKTPAAAKTTTTKSAPVKKSAAKSAATTSTATSSTSKAAAKKSTTKAASSTSAASKKAAPAKTSATKKASAAKAAPAKKATAKKTATKKSS
jgi:DNA-binding protein HU-beta